LVGGGTRKMLLRALELLDAPRDEAEVARMNTAIIARYEAHIAVHSALFAGGAAMLDTLAARGVALAVVTNKMEHLARQLLDALGLSSRFFTIIGGDTLGPGRAKPAPDLLHLMALRSGLASPRVAFVGDTTFDTRAAQAAGWPCVVVRFGYCDAPPEDMGGTAIIGHFDELVPALEGLPG
jgi:phosphoglycolate phosphatase